MEIGFPFAIKALSNEHYPNVTKTLVIELIQANSSVKQNSSSSNSITDYEVIDFKTNKVKV